LPLILDRPTVGGTLTALQENSTASATFATSLLAASVGDDIPFFSDESEVLSPSPRIGHTFVQLDHSQQLIQHRFVHRVGRRIVAL